MKKLFLLLCVSFFVSFLSTAHVAFAAQPTIGVYVAPKFIYGYALMENFKGSSSFEAFLPFRDSTDLGQASSDETDSTFAGALAIGYDFAPRFSLPLRVELEYALFSKIKGDISTSLMNPVSARGLHFQGQHDSFMDMKMDIQTLFLNGYFDIATGTSFTPYLGAGLGMAFIDTKSRSRFVINNIMLAESSASRAMTNFAWHAGAGVGWKIADPLTLDLGYRFVSLGEVKGAEGRRAEEVGFPEDYLSFKETENLYMHQILLSLRYTF